MCLPSRNQRARYLTVVVGGALLDLAISAGVVLLLGLPVEAAGAIGFGCALAMNYVLFEFWVYSDAESRLSPSRFTAVLASAMATLGFRLIILTALGLFLPRTPLSDVVRLVLAMSGSMALNYALVQKVFRRTHASSSREHQTAQSNTHRGPS